MYRVRGGTERAPGEPQFSRAHSSLPAHSYGLGCPEPGPRLGQLGTAVLRLHPSPVAQSMGRDAVPLPTSHQAAAGSPSEQQPAAHPLPWQ